MKKQKVLPLTIAIVIWGSISVHAGSEGDGISNVYYGDHAGDNVTGALNVFVGFASGEATASGHRNTFVGSQSGISNDDGAENVFIGHQSGYTNTSGEKNIFTGYMSGYSNTTGYENVFSGYMSGYRNTTGRYNIFSGSHSGYSNTSGHTNIFIGYRSGVNNTEGNSNVFTGYEAGRSNTEGDNNVFIGTGSGSWNTTGYFNTFSGNGSGAYNKTGSRNVFTGYASGYWANVDNSVFLGYQAGKNATRSNTLYIANTDTESPLIYGEFNTSMVRINGNFDVNGSAIFNGELNTTKAITAAFEGSTTKQALKMMDISVNNTDTNVKSDVGFAMTNAREGFTWSFRTWEEDNGFAISKYGNGANKEFRLYDTVPDDASTVVLELANGAWCDGVWHNTSSRNMKQDIEPLSTKEALEAFKKLQPVTYAYKSNPTDPKVGFIAEDVPELVADPKHKSLSAMDMVALLTKVVQVQEEKMEEKDVEMEEMKAKQKLQAEKIAKIESLLTNLALETSNKDKDQLSVNLK